MDSTIKELMNCIDRKALYDAISILYKIVSSVCCYPEKAAYQKISLESEEILNFLLPVNGAMECLFQVGFEEGDDSGVLQLQSTTKMADVSKFRNILRLEKQKMEEVDFKASSINPSSFLQVLINLHRLRCAWLTDVGISNLSYKEIPHEFLNRYLERERTKAEEAIPKEIFDEELTKLQFLVTWFKNEFYEWVDRPVCRKCKTPTTGRGTKSPSSTQNYRVELYQCDKCGKHFEFPRYKDPEKLLETRKGRCGEWAISFTHMCRALDLDARLVDDATDHVWTEVFLHLDYKWVHCDPCEGTIDAPLTYEAGWKKNLSYIFAYSPDEIQDVTWRYSSNHAQVLARRKQVGEIELAQFLADYRIACLERKSEHRRKFVNERCAKELATMMFEDKPGDGDLLGRTSGSLEWRLSRRETELKPFVWDISEKTVKGNEWTFGYSAAKDCYYVGGVPVAKKWDNGISSNQNVYRKVEKDWQMVYLSRFEGMDSGEISWSFQLEDGLVIDKLVFDLSYAVFETGAVHFTTNSNDMPEIKLPEGRFETSALNGQRSFDVKARLSGGSGSAAWQHAQLFRQKLADRTIPFQIAVRVSRIMT